MILKFYGNHDTELLSLDLDEYDDTSTFSFEFIQQSEPRHIGNLYIYFHNILIEKLLKLNKDLNTEVDLKDVIKVVLVNSYTNNIIFDSQLLDVRYYNYCITIDDNLDVEDSILKNSKLTIRYSDRKGDLV